MPLLSISHAQQILDHYVREAIRNNLQVKSKTLLVQKQQSSLALARKGYGPEVKFLTNYTLATGGRSIDFPVGTLLNGLYSDMNNTLGYEKYQPLQDQTVQFLPNNYYDTRIRITQPILQPEIRYNRLIKEQELGLAELGTDVTTRDLVRDVKTTYFQWMQAHDAVEIINQGLALLKENKRITESLIRNGVGIPSALIRIESEINYVEAQQKKTTSDLANAAAYFNQLLNRNEDDPIEADSFPSLPAVDAALDITNREELRQITTGNQIQNLALDLEEKHFAPRLGMQVDVGSQEFVPSWGGYVLAGVQLEIPIWDNNKSKLKRAEWASSLASNDAQLEWTQTSLQTQLNNEVRSFQADLAIYESYTSSLQSNERYYNETLKRYKEGLANYIELLDARTQVTNTKLQQNIARYQSWIRQVNIERISATYLLQ